MPGTLGESEDVGAPGEPSLEDCEGSGFGGIGGTTMIRGAGLGGSEGGGGAIVGSVGDGSVEGATAVPVGVGVPVAGGAGVWEPGGAGVGGMEVVLLVGNGALCVARGLPVTVDDGDGFEKDGFGDALVEDGFGVGLPDGGRLNPLGDGELEIGAPGVLHPESKIALPAGQFRPG